AAFKNYVKSIGDKYLNKVLLCVHNLLFVFSVFSQTIEKI
ncbi:MAG: hypothetical protein ACI82E_001108, partial [Nonlabens sp.]